MFFLSFLLLFFLRFFLSFSSRELLFCHFRQHLSLQRLSYLPPPPPHTHISSLPSCVGRLLGFAPPLPQHTHFQPPVPPSRLISSEFLTLRCGTCAHAVIWQNILRESLCCHHRHKKQIAEFSGGRSPAEMTKWLKVRNTRLTGAQYCRRHTAATAFFLVFFFFFVVVVRLFSSFLIPFSISFVTSFCFVSILLSSVQFYSAHFVIALRKSLRLSKAAKQVHNIVYM